jgi:hypothetical protein
LQRYLVGRRTVNVNRTINVLDAYTGGRFDLIRLLDRLFKGAVSCGAAADKRQRPCNKYQAKDLSANSC